MIRNSRVPNDVLRNSALYLTIQWKDMRTSFTAVELGRFTVKNFSIGELWIIELWRNFRDVENINKTEDILHSE